MNYHDIKHDDMNNGDGLRVTLFVSGCDHYCSDCQNKETWDTKSGILFDETAKEEIFTELSHDYISGITLSGGDPLNGKNVRYIYNFLKELKTKFPNKTIWIYTGYVWEDIFYQPTETWLRLTQTDDYRKTIIEEFVDVLVDGIFISELADVNYHWAGSTNQRVIDVKQSLKENKIVLWH